MEVSGSVPSAPSSDICSICHYCLSASPPDDSWWWSLVYGKSLKLSCKHEFHSYCLKNWQRARKSSMCPLCRSYEKDVTLANEGRPTIPPSIGNARCMECRCIFTREEGIPEGNLEYFHCQSCASTTTASGACHCFYRA